MVRRSNPAYKDSVFINCPFDQQYSTIFPALVFTVTDCGFIPRSALEEANGSESRIEKIYRIIGECKYGIHDISRTELNADRLPRFNMPLELGIFLGARKYGTRSQKQKVGVILDRERFRYQKFCSDLAGNDPQSHENWPERAVIEVRNWLRTARKKVIIPSGDKIWERYQEFQRDLPIIASDSALDHEHLIFNDLTTVIELWLKKNPFP